MQASLLFTARRLRRTPSDEEEYKPVLPDVSIYKAMLDANKATGWIQFRNYDDKQLIYFTTLQTMHCRLSEIRYSVNSDALDKRFPLGKCNPQIPFNLPDDNTNEYVYISLPAGEAKTLDHPGRLGRRRRQRDRRLQTVRGRRRRDLRSHQDHQEAEEATAAADASRLADPGRAIGNTGQDLYRADTLNGSPPLGWVVSRCTGHSRPAHNGSGSDR